MTAVQKLEPVQTAPVAHSGGSHSTIIMALDRMLTDPDMPMERIQYAMDTIKDLEAQQALKEFNEALAASQSEMPAVIKNRRNSHTKSNYADLATINAAAQPIYAAHGLSASFSSFNSEMAGHLGVQCELSHSGGHVKVYRADIPLDGAGMKGGTNKTAVQAFGSTMTYGQRYLICLIFNIAAGEDNDGNKTASPKAHITAEQVKQLEALTKETDTNRERLLKHIGCTDFTEVFADKFDDLVNFIKKTAEKRAASAEKGGDA